MLHAELRESQTQKMWTFAVVPRKLGGMFCGRRRQKAAVATQSNKPIKEVKVIPFFLFVLDMESKENITEEKWGLLTVAVASDAKRF